LLSKRIAVTAAVVTTAVGVIVLIGWTFDLNGLKSAGATITMKANMAIGLIACGAALASSAGVRLERSRSAACSQSSPECSGP
jgi:hypothetical protein